MRKISTVLWKWRHYFQPPKAWSGEEECKHFWIPHGPKWSPSIAKSNWILSKIPKSQKPQRHERLYGTFEPNNLLSLQRVKEIDGEVKRHTKIYKTMGLDQNKPRNFWCSKKESGHWLWEGHQAPHLTRKHPLGAAVRLVEGGIWIYIVWGHLWPSKNVIRKEWWCENAMLPGQVALDNGGRTL